MLYAAYYSKKFITINKLKNEKRIKRLPGERYDDRLGDIPTYYAGLTIRQQFAAMAMQALLSNETFIRMFGYEVVSEEAVRQSDKLIKELNKS